MNYIEQMCRTFSQKNPNLQQNFVLSACAYANILGECRTLWGEREQAMHCGIELLCS